MRWIVVVVMAGHGLIHLLGAAKGFGWADVTELTEPISPAMGLVRLAPAALLVATGVLLAVRARWWWIVGAVAVGHQDDHVAMRSGSFGEAAAAAAP